MRLMRLLRQPIVTFRGKVHSKAFHVPRSGLASASSLGEIRFRPLAEPDNFVTKKPKRPPFVAGFFCGQIDETMFDYSELSDQRLKQVKELASVVQEFYKSSVQVPEMETLNKIPDDVLKGLKSLGLFGMLVPKLYGGLELGATDMNYLAEVISQNSAIFHMINFHNTYGVSTLLKGGTEFQKQMLLPKLCTGDMTFGVCIWERCSGSDLRSIQTKAVPLGTDSFILSGTKIWVNNVDNADSLLVLANTGKGERQLDAELTFFIVDKNSAGITIKPVEKNCVEKLGMFEVSFDNTIVKAENMLGSRGAGFELASDAIANDRTIIPSAVIQTVRSLLDKVVSHVIHKDQFGEPLINFSLIKWKIASASMKLYALESMVYMTAALCDEYEDQNVRVESGITKVFALETLQYCLNIFSEIFSGQMIEKQFDLAPHWRDAYFLNVCEGTKDVTKMQITLDCLRLLSELKNDHVKKLRNPMYFPAEKLKDMFFYLKQSKDNPPISHVIAYNVHPSLGGPADMLEYCIYRLQWAADLNVVFSGLEIVNNQNTLIGLADIAIECYAMAAALARASRSYCTGIKNSETEVRTVYAFTNEQVAKVRRIVEYIDPYNPPLHATTIQDIAEATGNGKKYFAEHPLARNYA